MLVATERLSADERRDIIGHMPAGTLESIQETLRIAWVHADDVAAFSEAVFHALGAAGAERFWLDFSIRASSSSFLGAMHSAGLRMFGVKPSGFMRNFAVAHRMTTRDMGTVKVDIDNDARRGTVVYAQVPPKYLNEGFIVSSKGAIRAMFEIMKLVAQVTPDTSRLSEGQLTFDLTWR